MDKQALIEKVAKKLSQPYGNVTYADPGFRGDKKRYPIDTPEHVRAAASYIGHPKNAAKYSAGQLAHIKSAINRAEKSRGIGSDES